MANAKYFALVLSDEIYTGMRMLGANSISDLKPEMVEIMPGLLGEQCQSP